MKFYTTYQISENMHETPEGYLVCVGVPIARTGEMLYGPGETPLEVGPDGKVIVTRDAKEVFRPETIASFEGKAVTIQHPEDFVSPENWSELAKGILQNVRRGKGEQENDLVADLLVTDKVAIALVKNGLREVSCGYEAEYTQTGVGRGVQSELIGNHLALVEAGRAGSSYAIHDHKGKGLQMKLGDKIKAIFAKAQDEALALTKDEGAPGTPEKKEGFVSYDDFKAAMDKIDAFMGKQKDASTPPTQTEPAKIEAKDKEEEEAEKKKAARDAWIDAMMEKESKDAEKGEEGEESEDAEEEEESEDDCYTGDTAARIEILVPGMKAKGKDAKGKALLAAYATKDGKSVIDQFTGGKVPDVKDQTLVDSIFIGASEVLKVKRSAELAGTKTHDSNAGAPKSGPKTPEEINEMNAKFYGGKK